jgi:dihydrodipicolinate synthase/N-acetylneuraminate lyase
MKITELPADLLARFRQGMVIPALPLALDAGRRFAERHQRALIRYYAAAGAGGLAVGVHSTQFEIRDPAVGLFEPVLQLAAETLDAAATAGGRESIKIAGVCGRTPQALREAGFARNIGYHACLLSLTAFKDETVPAMLAHCREVAAVLPVIGFYLQPAVGGRTLPYAFWRRFSEIPNVLAIKIAPFNRYQTLDVIRALCDGGRERAITLYTGNDDNIVLDLLTEYRIVTPQGPRTARMVGGLLGHWGVWTRRAVELLDACHSLARAGAPIPPSMLTRAIEVTDANAAFFDAANHFAGCIPGIHEVLRRQGLLPGTLCLNPLEQLSPGQSEEIDRVCAAYPHLNDDAFVAAHRDTWLKP